VRGDEGSDYFVVEIAAACWPSFHCGEDGGGEKAEEGEGVE